MHLGAEVNPKMLQAESKAVPENYNPVPHYDYGTGEPRMVGLCRVFTEGFDRIEKRFDRMTNLFDRE